MNDWRNLLLQSFAKLLLTIFVSLSVAGCVINIDTSPKKTETSNLPDKAVETKISQLQNELNSLKQANERMANQLEQGLTNSKDFRPNTVKSDSVIGFLKEMVKTGKLHDDLGFRYVPVTAEDKSVGGLLSYKTDAGSNGIVVADRYGEYLNGVVNVLTECQQAYQAGPYLTKSKKNEFTLIENNHLCLDKNRPASYIFNLELRHPDWGNGRFVLSEFISFNVSPEMVLEYFVKAHPKARLIHSSY